MEVRLNINNVPPQPPSPASVEGTGGTMQKDQDPSSVTVSKREFPGFAGTEEVDAATEADVATRADKLGKLFDKAFTYAPPPMPDFT